ncbi:MAG: hypothetical protein ABII94_01145, partial [Patescibacteria group bacterium]
MDLKNINQYKDTEGITTKQLNFSLWLMRHKKFFRNIFIIFLIIISTIHPSQSLRLSSGDCNEAKIINFK